MKKLNLTSGQGLIEYALIIVFIALFVLVALKIFGTQLGSIFSSISSQLGSY